MLEVGLKSRGYYRAGLRGFDERQDGQDARTSWDARQHQRFVDQFIVAQE